MIPDTPFDGAAPQHPLDPIAPAHVRQILVCLLQAHEDAVVRVWRCEVARMPRLPGNGNRDAMVAAAYSSYVRYLLNGETAPFTALLPAFRHSMPSPAGTAATLCRVLGALSLAAFPILAESQPPVALHDSMALLLGSMDTAIECVGHALEDALAGEARHVRQRHVRIARDLTRIATRDRLRLVDPHEIPEPSGDAIPIREARDGAVLRYAAASAARALQMDQTRAEDLALAVGEAVSNVLKHAGCGVGHVWRCAGTVYVSVADEGEGITLENLPNALSPGWSSEPSLGMGFTLMLEMSDALWLSTGAFGTHLCIEKSVAD